VHTQIQIRWLYACWDTTLKQHGVAQQGRSILAAHMCKIPLSAAYSEPLSCQDITLSFPVEQKKHTQRFCSGCCVPTASFKIPAPGILNNHHKEPWDCL
jgi:hypothetical protein